MTPSNQLPLRLLKPLLLLACLALGGRALAADRLGLLHWPAIPVRDPAGELLISIAHAGDRLVAVGGHGLIIYSDDNGKSWHQAAVPTSDSITTIAFADAKNGWAAGAQGVILHTTDGGASWQMQLNGTQVLQLMVANAAKYAAANPGTDAAERAVRRADIMSHDGDDKPFLTILPTNAQTVTIFGAYRMAVRTEDGGKSWQDWSLNVGDPISHNMYQVTRVGDAIYLAGEAGSILRSNDQGLSYEMLTVPDQNTFFGILGTPKGSLVTFGVAGEIFRSTDQGQSWTQAQSSASSDLTSGIVLRSGEILLTSEDGNLFESKDDGQTFNEVGTNLRMGAYDVTQAANGDLVFVGSGGVRIEPVSSLD